MGNEFNAIDIEKEMEIAEMAASVKPRVKPFFEAKPYTTKYDYKREQPAHRLMCMLLAQGFMPGEVAERTGFSVATVTNVKAAPWAKEFIAELQQECGEKAVKNVLMGAALTAASTLVEFAEGKLECRPVDRIAANKEILNRCFGQAPQHVKHEKLDTSEMTDEELLQIALGKRN